MKKKISILYIFIFLFLFYSCDYKKNNRYKYIELQEIDTIALMLSDSKSNVEYDFQIYNNNNNTNKLLILYVNNLNLYIYNLSTKKLLKEIKLKKPIFSFYYLSKDSIFLLYQTAYFYDYCDTVLAIIDENGSIKKTFGINDEHFLTQNNIISEKQFYYPNTTFHKILYFDKKIFFNISKNYFYYLGDSASRSDNFANAAYIDLKTEKINFIFFPKYYPPENYFYPRNFSTKSICLSHNNLPMMAYRFTNYLNEYDYNKDIIISHYVKSDNFDTIMPSIDEKELSQFNYNDNYGKLWFVFYDMYKKLYYRMIILPEKYFDKNLLIAFDTNFTKIAEGFIPKHFGNHMIIENDGIIFWNSKKTFENEGYIVFTKYKINFIESKDSLIDLQKQMKEIGTCNNKIEKNVTKNIDEYLNLKLNKRDNYLAIIVPSLSCPSCIQYVLTMYSLNKESFLKNNVILIFEGENKISLKNQLLEKNILLSENVIIDDSNIYKQYHSETFYNPRVIIFENKNVKFDKVYKPDELEGIGQEIFTFISK